VHTFGRLHFTDYAAARLSLASSAAAATSAAELYATKTAKPKSPTVQCNFRVSAECRERLKRYAFANGMTERDLVEWFCNQLPVVDIPRVAAPVSVGFAAE
jgi:hypothetical protein